MSHTPTTSDPVVGIIVPLTSRAPQLPGEVRLHLGNCSEKQRRFVASLGSLLEREQGRDFRAVLTGQAVIAADVDGNAITQPRIQS